MPQPPEQLPDKLNRRTALKLLAGGAAGVVLPSAAAMSAPLCPAQSPQLSKGLSKEQLKIEVFTGQSTPEDTVLLSSTADHTVMLRQFMPGLLATGNRTLDLNQALLSGALSINAGAVRSVSLPLMRRQPDFTLREYLSVEAAVESVGAGAQIITLNALVDANGLAVVYIPQSEDAIEFA